MGRIGLFLCIAIIHCCSFTVSAVQKSDSLLNELEKYQKADDLSSWLYARIEYCTQNPQKRLNFLMLSQNNSWREPGTATEKEAWLHLLINQGYYQLYTGNVLSSIDQYEQAYSFYIKSPVKDFDLVEYLLKPLGNNYTRLGDYSRALFIHQKALKLASGAKDSLSVASIYSNMAIAYKSVGNLAQAERSCQNGFRYLSKGNALSGLLKSTLADIRYDQQRFDEAGNEVQLAIAMLVRSGQPETTRYWLLSAYTLAGNIASRREDFPRALEYYRRGIQLINSYFQGSRRREMANLLNQCGMVHLLSGTPSLALSYYQRSLAILLPDIPSSAISTKHLYGENRLYDALEGCGRALLMLNQAENSLRFFTLALEAGDRSRTEYASRSDRLHYQKDVKRLAGIAIGTAFELWKKEGAEQYAETILSLAERTKARTLLDQLEMNLEKAAVQQNDPLFKQKQSLERAINYYERESLLDKSDQKDLNVSKQEAQYKLSLVNKEIRTRYPGFRKPGTVMQSPEQMLRKISSNLMVIEFFCGEQDIYSIIIRAGKIADIRKMPDPGSFKKLVADYVQKYFREGPAAMTNKPESFFKESTVIYKQLLQPVLNKTYQEKLMIIPDDVLGYLPFESLVTSSQYSSLVKNWRFLIDRHTISYAYSLNSWLIPSEEKKSRQPVFSGFFISSSDEGPEIPAVAREAESLKEQVKGLFFLNEKANVESFRKALQTSDVLHISTHSFMYGSQNEPALQLADGKFFLTELSIQQEVPRLVVLSACRTADGMLAEGEGVISLSRGFTAAGTNSIVAGLWNVNDNAGAHLISEFYTNMQKGLAGPEALCLAKRDWLKREHSNSALLLPYYWSSFIFIGKPALIKIEKPESMLKYTLLSGFVLLMAGLISWKKRRRPPL